MVDFTVLEARFNLFIVDFVEYGFFSTISNISKFVLIHFLVSIFVFIPRLWIYSLVQIVYASICNIFKTSDMFFVVISIAEHFAAVTTLVFLLFVDMSV